MRGLLERSAIANPTEMPSFGKGVEALNKPYVQLELLAYSTSSTAAMIEMTKDKHVDSSRIVNENLH